MLSHYVSFKDSVLFRLSSISWRRGNDNFFIEKVPYSFSSGAEYAKLCLELITLFTKCTNVAPNVLECGSGNGIFAKRLVNKLENNFSEFNYIVTEYSQKLLNFYTWAKSFDNVHTAELDMMNIQSLPKSNISIMTYLLDMLPCYCLYYSNDTLFEYRVSVNLKKDVSLTNSFVYPFKRFSESELEQFLRDDISDDYLSMVSRLQDVFEIKWKAFPVEVSDVDGSGFLEEWLASKQGEGFYFNYSPHYVDILNTFKEKSEDSFMLICYDFATSVQDRVSHLDKLYGRFGACFFTNINYSLLDFYCQKHNLSFVGSSYNNSENQMGIITSVSEESFIRDLKDVFAKPEPGLSSYGWVKTFEKIDNVTTLLAEVGNAQQKLSYEETQDYVFLFTLAKKFYSLLSYDNALFYLDFILHDYGDLSLDAVVLKSKILRKQRYHKEALDLVLNIINQGTSYDMLYLELIFIYAELNQPEEFQQALKDYFTYFTYKPQWQLAELIR